MNKMTMAMVLLLAANVQMVGVAVFSLWIGNYLNSVYPIKMNWLIISISIGVLTILHTFYMIFVVLRRMEKKVERNI